MTVGHFLVAFSILAIGAAISLVINHMHLPYRFRFKSAAIIVSVLLAALVILNSINTTTETRAQRPIQNSQSSFPSYSYSPTPSDLPSDTTSATEVTPTDESTTPSLSRSASLASIYFSDVAPLVRYDPHGGKNSRNESMSIRGKVYSHAIHEYSGCQNTDGGDYWADYTVANTWARLTGVVGMSDASKSLTPISWRIYLNNVIALQGVAEYGQATNIDLSMKDIYTVRLWMNDPQAPKAVCGFGYFGALAWGDLTLST